MVHLAVLALLMLTAGCHRYVPVQGGAVPEGSEVRIHVSDDRARNIEAMYGARMVPLSGEVESWSSAVVLGVQVPAAPGMLDRGLRNRVVIPAADIISVELRELDRNRTIVLTTALAATVVAAAVAALTGTFGGSTAVDPPVEQDSMIPVWGFDVPLWLKVFR